MADDPVTAFLPVIKSYLRITWDDSANDALIRGYIARGMKRLQDIAGASLDFTSEDLPRALLFDYCRYANSQALEVFEKNFESDLLELNLRTQAPIIDSLVINAQSDGFGITVLSVSPKLQENDSYVYKVGTELTLPVHMELCGPPSFTIWDGISIIPGGAGSQILIVEVNDEFEAKRAQVVTVS